MAKNTKLDKLNAKYGLATSYGAAGDGTGKNTATTRKAIDKLNEKYGVYDMTRGRDKHLAPGVSSAEVTHQRVALDNADKFASATLPSLNIPTREDAQTRVAALKAKQLQRADNFIRSDEPKRQYLALRKAEIDRKNDFEAKKAAYNATHTPSELSNDMPKMKTPVTLKGIKNSLNDPSTIGGAFSDAMAQGMSAQSIAKVIDKIEAKSGVQSPDGRTISQTAAERFAKGQTAHPKASAAGNVAGGLAKMLTIGGATGSIGGAGVAGRAISGAATGAVDSVINNIGDLVQGDQTAKDFAKNVLVESGAMGAGGAAGAAIGKGISGELIKRNMQTPFAEFVRQVVSGTGSAGARVGVNYVANMKVTDAFRNQYLASNPAATEDEIQSAYTKALNRRAAVDMAVSFAFSVINGYQSTLESTKQGAASINSEYEKMMSKFDAIRKNPAASNVQELADDVLESCNSIKKELNSTYYAGQQNMVNQMNEMLDTVIKGTNEYMSNLNTQVPSVVTNIPVADMPVIEQSATSGETPVNDAPVVNDPVVPAAVEQTPVEAPIKAPVETVKPVQAPVETAISDTEDTARNDDWYIPDEERIDSKENEEYLTLDSDADVNDLGLSMEPTVNKNVVELDNRIKSGTGKKLTTAFVDDAVEQVKLWSGSDVPTAAIKRKLISIYRAAEAKDADQMYALETELADELIKPTYDKYELARWKEFKGILKDMRLKPSEALKAEIGGAKEFKNWKNKNFSNGIRISNDGRQIDEYYTALNEWDSSIFPDDLGDIDRFNRLREALDELKPVADYGDLQGYSVDEIKQSLIDDINDGYFGSYKVMAQRAGGYAEIRSKTPEEIRRAEIKQKIKAKYEQKLSDQKEKYKLKLADKDVKYKEKLAARDDKYKLKLADQKEKLKADKQTAVEKQQQKHKDYVLKKKEQWDDAKARQNLLKLVRNGAKIARNKPDEAARLIDDIINGVDNKAIRLLPKTRDELIAKQAEIEKLAKEDDDFATLHAPRMLKKVARLSQKQIGDMSLDEVEELATELSTLIHYQKTADKLLKDEKKRNISEMGKSWMKDIDSQKGVDTSSGFKKAISNYALNNLNPMRAIRRLSGYRRDSVGEELMKGVLDGKTKAVAFEQKARQPFDEFARANKAFTRNASKQNIEVEIDGKAVKISPGMRVSLYMHSQNTDNLNHIAAGGITIPDSKLYAKGDYTNAYGSGTIVHITPTELKQILSDMPAEEKEYAGLLENFFKAAADAINDTSVDLDGVTRANVDKYFPISSNKSFLESNDSFEADPSLEGWNNLKERNHGNNPIMLEDATMVLERHITKTADYSGLAVPMRNFRKVFNYTTASKGNGDALGFKSVKDSMTRAWGGEAVKYVEQFLKDVNAGGRRFEHAGAEALRGAYAGSVLTLNPSVAVKQTTSYFMAGSILSNKGLAYGLTHPFTKTDEAYMDSITPWGWNRRRGQSSIELGDMAKSKGFASKLPNWNQAMDVVTTNALFKATEYDVQKEYPNLKRGSEKYDKALAEKYNAVLWRTQPQYDVVFRPEYLRKTDVMSRTLGMFKTEAMQMTGELMDAIGQYKADKKSGNTAESKKTLYKTVGAWVAANLSFAAMGAIMKFALHNIKNYRDDNGEIDPDKVMSDIYSSFASSAAGGFFGGSFVYDTANYFNKLRKGDNKAQWYDLEAPGMSIINDLITSSGNLYTIVLKDDATKEDITKAVSNFALNAAKLTPYGAAQNVYKMADAVNLYIQDLKEDTFGKFESGENLLYLKDTSVTKQQYANRAIKLYSEGDRSGGDEALKKTNTSAIIKALKPKSRDKEDVVKALLDSPLPEFEKGRIYEEEYGSQALSIWKRMSGARYKFMELEGISNLTEGELTKMHERGIKGNTVYDYIKNKKKVSLNDVPDNGYKSDTSLYKSIGNANVNENWHHIVEQEQKKLPVEKIQNSRNVVSIQGGADSVHTLVTKYYQSTQDFTDGKRVNEWLSDKSFEEQWQFGVDYLSQYGQMIPAKDCWYFVPYSSKQIKQAIDDLDTNVIKSSDNFREWTKKGYSEEEYLNGYKEVSEAKDKGNQSEVIEYLKKNVERNKWGYYWKMLNYKSDVYEAVNTYDKKLKKK